MLDRIARRARGLPRRDRGRREDAIGHATDAHERQRTAPAHVIAEVRAHVGDLRRRQVRRDHLLEVVAERAWPQRDVHRRRAGLLETVGTRDVRERQRLGHRAERRRQGAAVGAWKARAAAALDREATRRVVRWRVSGRRARGVVGRRPLRNQRDAPREAMRGEQLGELRGGDRLARLRADAEHHDAIEALGQVVRRERHRDRHADALGLGVVHGPEQRALDREVPEGDEVRVPFADVGRERQREWLDDVAARHARPLDTATIGDDGPGARQRGGAHLGQAVVSQLDRRERRRLRWTRREVRRCRDLDEPGGALRGIPRRQRAPGVEFGAWLPASRPVGDRVLPLGAGRRATVAVGEDLVGVDADPQRRRALREARLQANREERDRKIGAEPLELERKVTHVLPRRETVRAGGRRRRARRAPAAGA
ncbi:MAG: hypothetical protein JNK64_02970 [Myxococcales bacterium]|nr:hypothetical protein [Myxococcales bacterium]